MDGGQGNKLHAPGPGIMTFRAGLCASSSPATKRILIPPVPHDPPSLCVTGNPTFWDIISVSINRLGTNRNYLDLLPPLTISTNPCTGMGSLISTFHACGSLILSPQASVVGEIALNIIKSALPEVCPPHELTHLWNCPSYEATRFWLTRYFVL